MEINWEPNNRVQEDGVDRAARDASVGLLNMTENGSKKVRPKGIAIVIISALSFLMCLIAYYFFSKLFGTILLVITGIYFGLELSKIPRETKESLAEAAEKYDQSLFGKIGKLFGFALIGYILYALIATSLK